MYTIWGGTKICIHFVNNKTGSATQAKYLPRKQLKTIEMHNSSEEVILNIVTWTSSKWVFHMFPRGKQNRAICMYRNNLTEIMWIFSEGQQLAPIFL